MKVKTLQHKIKEAIVFSKYPSDAIVGCENIAIELALDFSLWVSENAIFDHKSKLYVLRKPIKHQEGYGHTIQGLYLNFYPWHK